MQLTGQDQMSVVELHIMLQPCVFMLAPERGREGMIWLSFGWHRIFIKEAMCECERERKQACMTACWVSHCCPPLHSWYWQSELEFKFISRRKRKGTFCKSCMSLRSTLTLLHTILVNEYRVGVYNVCLKQRVCLFILYESVIKFSKNFVE